MKSGFGIWHLVLSRGTLFRYQQPLKRLKNSKLEDQFKFVSNRFGAVRAFEMLLKTISKTDGKF
jgi:hypothetical protein